MGRYDFDSTIDRRNTDSVKWDSPLMQEDSALLPLWVADMDFPVLPEIQEVLHQIVDHGVFGYSLVSDAYLESVAGWMEKRHGWKIHKDWILGAPGIVPAINAAIQAFTRPQEEILIFSPVYFPFLMGIEHNDRTPVQFELELRDGHYEIDFEKLEEVLKTHDIKMVIFCSPHNPIGRVWTRQELEKLAELCRKYHIFVISDEIHMDLVYAPHRHLPFLAAAPDMASQAIVCTAPSKTFNLAGLQTSSLIVPDSTVRNRLARHFARSGVVTPSRMGIKACQAAYTCGEDWLDELLVYLQENTAFVRQWLQENLPEVRLIEPEGLYLLWLDFRALGLNGQKLEELMLKKGHVWLDEGYIFGPGGEGFERINIACPRSTLACALEQIGRAVQEWKASDRPEKLPKIQGE